MFAYKTGKSVMAIVEILTIRDSWGVGGERKVLVHIVTCIKPVVSFDIINK